MAKSQLISDKFEDKIDPFDLDVFSPYIQNNIKRSVQRTQVSLHFPSGGAASGVSLYVFMFEIS